MTPKEREDAFIEKYKKTIGPVTWETELILRYGYSEGASEEREIAYWEGIEDQQTRVLDVLGAKPRGRCP